MVGPPLPTLVILGTEADRLDDIRTLVATKKNWCCVTAETVEQAKQHLFAAEAAIAVLCVRNTNAFEAAMDVLETAKLTRTPSIVLYDRLDSLQLLQLFQAGAAECLGRPINVSRLSLIMDFLLAPVLATLPRTRLHSKTGSQAVSRDDSQTDAHASLPSTLVGPPNINGPNIDEPNAANLDARLRNQVRQVAALDTTVVITGETGTGKTRLAKAIHHASPRCKRPFLAVNCGALSETLMDSELFGHVRGAFTGADQDRMGKLAQCQDGTLLLDEVDMLSPAAQVRLLQVVEDRVFQAVGGTEYHPLRARLIVASNRCLKQEVDDGRFRLDLYYRLNVLTFHLPPLRERQEEIALLADRFAAEFAQHHGFATPAISRPALGALQRYAWPGNVRELRNVIERAVILSGGKEITTSHLADSVREVMREPTSAVATCCPPEAIEPPADTRTNPKHSDQQPANQLAAARREAERRQLLKALQRNDNNRSKTALDLGISRVALYKRLRKFHIL